MYNFFLSHPRKVCMTYIDHAKFSGNLGIKLLVGSLKALIHAIIPELYKTSTSDLVNEIKTDIENSGCNKLK